MVVTKGKVIKPAEVLVVGTQGPKEGRDQKNTARPRTRKNLQLLLQVALQKILLGRNNYYPLTKAPLDIHSSKVKNPLKCTIVI